MLTMRNENVPVGLVMVFCSARLKTILFFSWEVNLMAVSCASWTPLVGEVFHYRQLATPGVASGELGSMQPVQFAQATCQNPQLFPAASRDCFQLPLVLKPIAQPGSWFHPFPGSPCLPGGDEEAVPAGFPLRPCTPCHKTG